MDLSRQHNGTVLKYIHINSPEEMFVQEDRTLENTKAEKDTRIPPKKKSPF
jgi:hypothetical protein